MNTSPAYIEAAESGIVDAMKATPVVTCGTGDAPPAFTLGLHAVRNCRYQKSNRPSKENQQDPILSASYILGSIHDQAMQELTKIVNPSNPAEQRIAALLQLSSFTAANGDVTGTMKRKVAEICDDILLAFHATAMAEQSVQLQSMVENCFAQLLQSKENEKKALEVAKKQSVSIKNLLESKARTDESRRRAEESRLNSEKLIKILAAQLDLEEKSNTALVTIPTVPNEN